MGYYTDRTVRMQVDNLLMINARIQANLGTRSKYDVGSKSASQELWLHLLEDIRKHDHEFYSTLASKEEQEMLANKVYNKAKWLAIKNGTV